MPYNFLDLLRDYIFYIIRVWKKTLICGLILGILFSSFSVFRTLKSWDAKTALVEEYTAAYNNTMAVYSDSISNIRKTISEENQRIIDNNAELSDSIIFDFTSGNVATSSNTIYFLNGEIPLGYLVYTVLIDRYETLFIAQLDWDRIADETGIEDPFLEKLFIVDKDLNGSKITLTVICDDVLKSEAILNSIMTQFDEAYESIADEYGYFNIIQTGVYSSYGFSSEAAELYSSTIGDTSDKFTLKDSLKADIKKIKSEYPAPPVEKPSVMLTIKGAAKYMLFGLAIVFILVSVYRFINKFFGELIVSCKQLKSFCPGICAAASSGKKADKLFYLENNVNVYSLKDAIRRIILISNVDSDGKILIAGDVKGLNFSDIGYNIDVREEVITDVDVFKNASDYSGAIYIAVRDKSNKMKILNDINCTDIKTIGSVLVI